MKGRTQKGELFRSISFFDNASSDAEGGGGRRENADMKGKQTEKREHK